ncbi:MAG: Phenylacetic acid catabolic protein, partial [Flavobacteriales bacterium]
MKWKIKRQSNDELREEFITKTVPQAEFLGLSIPDDNLKWNEEQQNYDHSPIDWEEFYNVVGGKGICNKQRLEARTKAEENGEWVRQAAEAYAKKHTN